MPARDERDDWFAKVGAYLTAPVWDWTDRYSDVINAAKDGNYTPESWWGGMADGVVDIEIPSDSPVADEMQQEGRSEEYRLLSPVLTDDRPDRSYREIAGRLESTEAAVKMAVLRLRRRYGRLLRDEIAQTVAAEDEIDAELRQLLTVLREG